MKRPDVPFLFLLILAAASHKSLCTQFSRGVYSILGVVSPDSFDTLHSYSNTFQMPFMTPWFPEKVLTPSSGLLDFAISMRPDYHRAIIDTVRYYGWKKIIYLYDSHDDVETRQESSVLRTYKLPAAKKRYCFERKTREAEEEDASRCFLNSEKVVRVAGPTTDKTAGGMQQEISIAKESHEVGSQRKGIMDGEMCRQALIGLMCNLLIIDSGFQEGWSTPTIAKFASREDPLRVNTDQIGWIVNLLYVGIGFGSTMPFFLMNRIGRKKTLLLSVFPKVASWVLIGLASDRASMFCGRILAGIGCGISYSVLPMYFGEISSKRTRGLLGTMLSVSLNVGVLLVCSIGLWISRFAMAMIGMCLPISFLITFPWLPESSVFLMRRNELSLAEKTLRWALGKDDIEEELEEIQRTLAMENSSKNRNFLEIVKEMYEKKGNARAFGIILILFSALSLTGGAPILAYQSEIFEKAKFEVPTNLSIIMTCCVIVIAGTICVLLVRITGKRALLLSSAPASLFALITLSIFFTLLSAGYDVSKFNWIPSVFVVIYILGYGLAMNPMPLAYLGEIFSFEMKRTAAIFTSLYYAGTTTMIIKYYQIMQDSYGTHVPLWTFAGITMILWILIYFFVPETEGKTVEEILLELRNNKEGIVEQN
ncbi:facilitated trehalose transporter Tret1-like [Vespula squamosa]|uniref:Facilitated trehalose transporter Tret1-like n=1 Tax=Vespula squamosa TaxID=30214 RepID=A0ABD2AIL7_VESSQ